MEIFSGYRKEMSDQLYINMLKYRYLIFVEKMNWKLKTINYLEFDEFDNDDSFYVIAYIDDDIVVGCFRLLITSKPYLLKDVFSKDFSDFIMPDNNDVYEITRFSSGSIFENYPNHYSCTSLLLKELKEFLISRKVKYFISLSPLGIKNILNSHGFSCIKLSDLTFVGDRKYVIYKISI